jgi:Leucine-rich repeat (LRR) protein
MPKLEELYIESN